MTVLIVVDGEGTPKLVFDSRKAIGDAAFDEAYDLLKRGVEGHFQMIPLDTGNFDYIIGHVFAGQIPPGQKKGRRR